MGEAGISLVRYVRWCVVHCKWAGRYRVGKVVMDYNRMLVVVGSGIYPFSEL